MIKFETESRNPARLYDAIQDGQFRTLWLVLAHDRVADPGHTLVETAAARYPWSFAQYPNTGFIRVLGYSLRWRHAALPEAAQALTPPAQFANGVQLLGYRVDATQLPATEQLAHPPSNWLHVTAYWSRAAVVQGAAVRPFVRLAGVEGDWGVELPREPSVFAFDPPAGWPAGQIIETHHDVNLNPLTPAGALALRIGLQTASGERMGVRGAEDFVELRDIEITR